MHLFLKNKMSGKTQEKAARRVFAVILFFSGFVGQSVFGQAPVLEHFNPLSSNSAGVHLYGATISSSYFSSSYGTGVSGVGFGATADAPVTMMQGSAVLGWSRPGPNSSFSVIYSPSYVRGIYGSGYRSLNHSLAVSSSRTLGSKWSLGTSINAIISDYSQLLVAPSPYGNVSAVTATFDELAAAMLIGSSPNAALNQAVNSASLNNSPETAFLYGNRIFSASAMVSLSYAYSSRSSLGISLTGSRTQQYQSGNTGSASVTALIPRTSSGSANLGWSYSLTPRTSLSVSIASGRAFSRYQDAFTTQTNVSVGRTLSRQWFVNGMVGVGFITPIRSTLNPSQGPQELYGGGIGYKFFAQTLVASYARSIADAYGLGASATESITTAWTWKRPGRSVAVSASAAYSRMLGDAFANSQSWVFYGSVGKSLNAHLALSGGYSYTQFPGSLFITAPSLSQNGVSVSLSWSPSERQ